MKPTLYIETSVIGYYTSRLSGNLVTAGLQKVTRDWWPYMLDEYEPIISSVVIEEIGDGDPIAVEERFDAIQDFRILENNPAIKAIADRYFFSLKIPERARNDTFHLAFAAYYRVNYLVTWNCKHIANVHLLKMIQEINKEHGIDTPVICTPLELQAGIEE